MLDKECYGDNINRKKLMTASNFNRFIKTKLFHYYIHLINHLIGDSLRLAGFHFHESCSSIK